MKTRTCAVVIPHHRETLTPNELISLKNSLSKLNAWDIYFVMPENLSSTKIENVLLEMNSRAKILKVNSEFLSSFRSYNLMCMNKEFYKLFINYDFMLLCQLDCWIFKDALQSWIEQDFDYIGAPWPSGLSHKSFLRTWDKFLKYLYVLKISSFNPVYLPQGGNGGLSLRNTQAHIQVLDSTHYKKNWRFVRKHLFFYLMRFRICTLYDFLVKFFKHFKDSKGYCKSQELNEDIFFSFLIPAYHPTFKVAPPEIARFFSLESNIENELSQMKNLPFGLHKWDPVFTPGEVLILGAK